MPWFQQSHDQQPMTSDSRTLTASIGVAVSGVLWGVFWMPVRYMESQSLGGPWPSIVFWCDDLNGHTHRTDVMAFAYPQYA